MSSNNIKPKLKPAIKARWVAALRSGKYIQGRGALHSTAPDRFCCLGVLCELAVADGVVTPSPEGDMVEYVGLTGTDRNSAVPPSPVITWAYEVQPAYSVEWDLLPTALANELPPDGTYLPSLNDSGNYTFGQIADLIEEYM